MKNSLDEGTPEMFAVTINYGFLNREKDNKSKLQFRLSQNLNSLFPVTRMLAYPRYFLYSSLQLADDFFFVFSLI